MDKMETDYIAIIEGTSSLKSLLGALNTKVAQMQIKLNTISANVGVNTSTTDVEEVRHGKPIVYEVHKRHVTGADVDETGTPFLMQKEYVEEREQCLFVTLRFLVNGVIIVINVVQKWIRRINNGRCNNFI